MSKGAGEILFDDYHLIVLRVMRSVSNAESTLSKFMYDAVRPNFHSKRERDAVVYSWGRLIHISKVCVSDDYVGLELFVC